MRWITMNTQLVYLRSPFTQVTAAGWAVDCDGSKVETGEEAHQHAASNQNSGVQSKAEQQGALQRHSVPWQGLQVATTILR